MKKKILITAILGFALVNSSGCQLMLAARLLEGKSNVATRNSARPVNNTVSQNWYEGAAGYDQAYPEFLATKAPAVIYFYADW